MGRITILFGIILILNGGVFAINNSSPSIETMNSHYQQGIDAKEIIKKLEIKFSVYITYESKILKLLGNYDETAVLEAKTMEKALELLTKNSSLIYQKIRNDFYVIIENAVNKNDTIRFIKGSVLNESGESLPGATIVINETMKGTTTDFDGNFFLPLEPGAKTYQINFLGYNTFTDSIRNISNLIIRLKPNTVDIDEVVISGVAGRTSTKKLTVTVAKINADQLNEAPASSAITSLQGKVSGVKITQSSGTPGSAASIRLRGSTSLTGDQAPLILVDGNIFESSLADINVDDIKSMEIVKGAAAASLYGSRAGSGVVVISTYRGNELKEGKTEIKIRNEFGISQIANNIELAKHHPYQLAEDYAEYTTFTKYQGVRYDEEGNIIRGSRRLEDDHIANKPYGTLIDNQDKFFNPGNYYTNYISVGNRSTKTNVFFSFENNKQSGILFSTDGYKRQNFRVNVDHQIYDKLKISTSNLLINANSDNPGSENSFFDLLFISPDVNLEQVNEDGSPYKIKPDPWSLEENPLYPLYYRQRESKRTSLLSNAILTYSPASWLNFDAKYTFENQFKYWNTYTPKGYLYGGGQSIDGSIYKEQYTSMFQTAQFTANYHESFNKLIVKANLSYLYEDESYYDFAVTGREFLTADVPQLNNTNAEKSTLNSYEGIIRAENIFGIVDLDYNDRYLLSALYRIDGSSLFGANERWNNYYRLSAAYRISQDIKIPGVNELKLRAAYGTSGQRPGFSNQYESWTVSNGSIQKSTLGNKDLKPSESGELEIALDAIVLHKFDLTISYSQTNTKDAFALAPLASHLGYPSQVQNVGTITSDAFEATLGMKLIEKKDFKWNANVTFDRIRQKITKLNIPQYKTGPNNAFLISEGETLGAIYGYRWLTDLSEMEAQLPTGRSITDYMLNSDGYVILSGTEGTISEKPILWDKDANGVADLSKIGDGNPNFSLGLSTTVIWRSFQVYALFDLKNGGDIYNYTHQYTFRDGTAIEFDQYGIAEDKQKTIDYYSTFYNNTALNSYFIEDGSYLKLRELSAFYTLQTKNMNNFLNALSTLRIGIIGHNLFTSTKYSGYDPEVTSGNDLSNFPFDNFGYPNYRTFKFSLELKF